LLDSSVFQGDLAVKCRSDAEDDRALDLGLDGVGIDGDAAIDRANDPVNMNLSILRHLDFGNLRHVGRKDELKGDAATETLRQRLSSFLRSQLEDGLGAVVDRLHEDASSNDNRVVKLIGESIRT